MFWGGANNIGFSGIRDAVRGLVPEPSAGLPQKRIIETLRANWFNGTDLGSQKSIAKSLIKLNLSPANASALATAAGVDAASLVAIATCISTGTALTPAQSDFFARFDLILTARLDEVFQHADQVYRNGTRALASLFSMGLALAGNAVAKLGFGEALLIGLLATPLAPIAKDLSSALAAAVDSMQLVKKA